MTRPILLFAGAVLSILLAHRVILAQEFWEPANSICGGAMLRCPRFGDNLVFATAGPAATSTSTSTATVTPTSTRTATSTPTPTATADQDFVVNSTGNGADANTVDPACETSTPGECTFQAALDQHNADGVQQTIGFNITGGGQHEINPTATYGTTGDLTIDCGSQPGSSPGHLGATGTYALPVWNIAFEANGTGFHMIAASPAGDLVIKGCEIRGFDSGAAAVVSLDVNGDALINSYLHGNASEQGINSAEGVNILIRNSVVDDSSGQGMVMGPSATGCVIEDCYLGLAPDGTSGAGNGTAIAISGGDANIIRRNVISANTTAVTISADGADDAENNQITDNIIGPDRTGSDAGNLCNFITDSGVGTVNTGNTLCTGCCAFDGVNDASATCIDAILWGGFVGSGIPDQATCDIIQGALNSAAAGVFNGAVNCSTPGNLGTTCAAP